MKPTLLIVDDEKHTRDGLRAALEDRYEVFVAEDAASATTLLETEDFAVLLTDFRLPKEDGMKLIARAKSLSRPPVCILMTAYGSEELAVEAMKSGADDYIAKGRLQIDELEMRIARALRQRDLEEENVALRQQLETKYGLQHIIGDDEGAVGTRKILHRQRYSRLLREFGDRLQAGDDITRTADLDPHRIGNVNRDQRAGDVAHFQRRGNRRFDRRILFVRYIQPQHNSQHHSQNFGGEIFPARSVDHDADLLLKKSISDAFLT